MGTKWQLAYREPQWSQWFYLRLFCRGQQQTQSSENTQRELQHNLFSFLLLHFILRWARAKNEWVCSGLARVCYLGERISARALCLLQLFFLSTELYSRQHAVMIAPNLATVRKQLLKRLLTHDVFAAIKETTFSSFTQASHLTLSRRSITVYVLFISSTK